MHRFSHLHCHTQYSLLDGAARIQTLLERAAEYEIEAVAITDHGNLFGVPEFYRTAEKIGIQPIIGCEFYLTPASRHDRNERTRYHQVLLAKNETGYRNLIKLSSLSYLEGYYYKPRIDHELLTQYHEGLIATTCCLQGEIPQTILHKGEEAARRLFEWYLELFGEDYYIEIQDHGLPEQKKVNAILLRWAQEYGVKVIATNDVHYVDRADFEPHDVLLCLQTGKDMSDPSRLRFDNDQFYLKSPAEMRQALLADIEPRLVDEMMANTGEVADKCRFQLPTGKLLMPHYPIPPEYNGDMDAYLRDLVFEGGRRRYGDPLPHDVVERLEHELAIIKKMGFAGYFLIVQDFTTAARRLGVRVGPGRGSAAGSAVAYCLGITNIDPLKYDLLFERFLNPERVSMPDIDIDFDDRGRGRVIDYVVQKYGRENVCQIITFGTMGAKMAIRDVARVLGIPLAEADRIAKLIPDGPKVTLAQAYEEVPELRALKESSDPQIRKLLHYAEVLEGSVRHTGVHAAGVIIAPGRVSDYVPVAVAKGKDNDTVTTQYDGKWIEEFGLLKMDFLGLKTLTILNDALQLIKENHGVEIDLDQIPLDDPKTFELFQRGETVAIFQFESEGMREWMRKLKPTSIDDLIAMNALYRPGPMDLIPNYIARKHGLEPVEYPHPLLEPVLKNTYGIPVYQEQVMEMARVIAGYTLGQADLLRRAMGKKRAEEMKRQREIFREGAARLHGISTEKADEIFDMMEKFAGYGFNKSHSAAYSIVAYQTAYLKANYPAEFMAAAMTSEMGDTKKLAVVLDEARRMGLELLPPSINRSQAHFTVEDGRIRFGLGAIKGVGLGAIEAILKVREKHGPFQTIFDLVRHLDLRVVNKKVLESLARAGALDELEGHRAQLVEAIDLAVQYAQKVQADRMAGQASLFGESGTRTALPPPNLPVVPPWSRARCLKEERELIGFYVTGHPLEAYRAEVNAFATTTLAELSRTLEEADVPRNGSANGHANGTANGHAYRPARPRHRICGIITEVQRRIGRNGRPLAFASIEDFTGQGELVIFSSVLERVMPYLEVDAVVLVEGQVEVRGGSVKILVDELWPMWKVRDELVEALVVQLDLEQVRPEQLDRFHALCREHTGRCKLYFDLLNPELPGGRQRLLSRRCLVELNDTLMQQTLRLFGAEAIRLESRRLSAPVRS
ncbi:DNA polymerase III, alpha subunit [Rhodothermus marinus SG0.5JP17-172]|uniref:DNA polymerase III subunit alpha n=1 Tax=Rhodothermus marinus TaxID=29549 RepID=UPI000223D844|nr:DNA polymerase III subunit alpha [Rhodothermus marinus]AEN72878.1 DNA polymerase III, alpha subunit [Rhodothermus marinus SG0.5JP17-172]